MYIYTHIITNRLQVNLLLSRSSADVSCERTAGEKVTFCFTVYKTARRQTEGGFGEREMATDILFYFYGLPKHPEKNPKAWTKKIPAPALGDNGLLGVLVCKKCSSSAGNTNCTHNGTNNAISSANDVSAVDNYSTKTILRGKIHGNIHLYILLNWKYLQVLNVKVHLLHVSLTPQTLKVFITNKVSCCCWEIYMGLVLLGDLPVRPFMLSNLHGKFHFIVKCDSFMTIERWSETRTSGFCSRSETNLVLLFIQYFPISPRPWRVKRLTE